LPGQEKRAGSAFPLSHWGSAVHPRKPHVSTDILGKKKRKRKKRKYMFY
jgi:hypothetical protein